MYTFRIPVAGAVVLTLALVLGSRPIASVSTTPSPTPDPVVATAVAMDVPADCVVQAMELRAEATAGTPEATPARTDEPLVVTIDLYDLYYVPCAIAIPADTPVTLSLTNLGTAIGNVVVDELGIASEELNEGDSLEMTIEAPAGEYAFYSDVPGQPAAGRAGILLVGELGGTSSTTPTPAAVATPAP